MLTTLRTRLAYGLKVKILAFMIPLLALVAASLGSYFLWQTSRLLTENEIKRISSLTRNLAFNSELGVSAEDADFLMMPIQSVLQDPAVESASVYGETGRLIAGVSQGQPMEYLPEFIRTVLKDSIKGVDGYDDRAEFLGNGEIVRPVTMKSLRVGEKYHSDPEEVFLDTPGDPGKKSERASTVIGYVRVTYTLQKIEKERQRFLAIGLLISGLVVVAGVGVSLLFAKRITYPLKQLRNALIHVGKGNLDCRIDVASQDELGTLSKEFNRMIQRLADAKKEIEEYQQTLEDQVKERTAELERANEDLKELDRIKDLFLSSVSHELRTPLTSIRSFSEILLRYPEEDPATEREFLSIINSESERLTRLINDVLDLAKIDAGRMEWHFEKLSPEVMVKRAVQGIQGLALEKNLSLEVHVEDELPEFIGDEDRMLQVLLNLLGNAIKFTHQGGAITISAELLKKKRMDDQSDFVRFSVTDTGLGISAVDLPRLFVRFTQCGNTLSDKPKGTGLGLAICKEIISHHGGRIWAESTPGQGSSFHFTVPVEPVGCATECESNNAANQTIHDCSYRA